MPIELVVIYIPLILLLIILTVVNFRTLLIPNRILFPGLVYFLIARILIGPSAIFSYLGGFLFMLIAALGISFLIEKLFRVQGIGGGDIKLLALVGLALGFSSAINVLIFASALGIIVFVIMTKLYKAQTIQSAWIISLSVFLVLALFNNWHNMDSHAFIARGHVSNSSYARIGFVLIMIGFAISYWFSSSLKKPRYNLPFVFRNPRFVMVGNALWVGMILGGVVLVFLSSRTLGIWTAIILGGLWYIFFKLSTPRQTETIMKTSYNAMRLKYPDEEERSILFRVLKTRYPTWDFDRLQTLLSDSKNIDDLTDKVIYYETGKWSGLDRMSYGDGE